MAMLTEKDVLEQTFTETKYREEGYDQEEVDDFLDLVADTIKALTDERDALRKEVADLQAQVQDGGGERVQQPEQPVSDHVEDPTAATSTASFAPQADQAEETASRPQTVAETGDQSANAAGVLALAQQLHDKYVNEGREESERLVNEAKGESDRIIREAEDQHNRTLTQLEQERGVLERKISELRDFERDYRSRMKSYLETLLSNVESGQSNPAGGI